MSGSIHHGGRARQVGASSPQLCTGVTPMTDLTPAERAAQRAPATGHVDRILLHIARAAIERRLAGQGYLPAPVELAPGPNGVFVTLWAPGHVLRGRSGRLGPLPDLAAAVAECAVSAALRDDHFQPVAIEELPRLAIELALLAPPQQVSDLGELDPALYGVLVEQDGRTGVLLPGIDGVDRAEDQVAIACRKGFIDPMRRFDIARFRVRTLRE
jgi:AMMECR1 domain-containing protein